MSPIAEILFTLAVTTIGVLFGYRAGFKRGVQIGSSPNIDFLRHIKLPTADEVKKEAEEKFSL